MNLLRLFKSLLIVVFLVASVTVAQDGTLISVVKINGVICIASTKEEFETLQSLALLIDACHNAEKRGTIDSTVYQEKVASYFKDARKAGIRMKKDN